MINSENIENQNFYDRNSVDVIYSENIENQNTRFLKSPNPNVIEASKKFSLKLPTRHVK